ncbi:MAG: hypothetical protein JWM02_1125 [Frankiales bacterium]|nr:hypothetical protein [Frankiales bacterium]
MTALRSWVATRVAVALLVLAGAAQVFGNRTQGFLDGWDSWDVTLFAKVAEFGYTGYPQHYPDQDIAAFFPGFPLVLRAVHTVVPDWTAAGLLVSLVAGAVAVVFLARLAELDGVDGSRAALYLVLSPYAVFLAAGYSEALFLACALPGWFAARKGHWAAASLLVAGACTVRVSGAFLAIGLIVEFLTTSREWRVAPWLAAPFLALFGYAAYLHHLTGDWLRWQHAQAGGWGRHLTAPLRSLQATWDASRSPGLGPEYHWSFRAEIIAVLVGVLVTLVLLARRSWGEATYVGLSVAALATSTYYLSVARATLLWFPLWVLLAELASRRPWVHTAYLVLATPLMAVAVLTFTAGRWVG